MRKPLDLTGRRFGHLLVQSFAGTRKVGSQSKRFWNCERWTSFISFCADMGPRPEGATLERDDVNGNYEPGNCRWATPIEQANNRRNNRPLTLNGETKTLAQWARYAGLTKQALRHRLESGWPLEEALRKGNSRGQRRDLCSVK
jgi:hypothetical protein